jgi:hypothetical protein
VSNALLGENSRVIRRLHALAFSIFFPIFLFFFWARACSKVYAKLVQDERWASSGNLLFCRSEKNFIAFCIRIRRFFSLFIMRVKGLLYAGVFMFSACYLVSGYCAEC